MHLLEGDSRVLCNFHPMCQFHFKTTHLAQILRISIFSFLLHPGRLFTIRIIIQQYKVKPFF